MTTFRLLFITVYSALSSGILYGQDSIPSRARKMTASQTSDLAWGFRSSNVDSALFYGLIALNKSREEGLPRIEAYSLADIGNAYSVMGKYEKANFYLSRSLKIRLSLNDTGDIISGYNNLGLLLKRRELLDSSVLIFERGIELANGNLYLEKRGILLNGLSTCLKELGHMKEAEEHLKESIEIAERTKGVNSYPERLLNMGNLYERIDRNEIAHRYYDDAKRVYELTNDTLKQIEILVNKGALYLKSSDFLNAIKVLEMGNELIAENNAFHGTNVVLNNLGLAYWGKGDIELAMKTMELVWQNAKDRGLSTTVVESGLHLAMFNLNQGNCDKAFEVLNEMSGTILASEQGRFISEYYLRSAEVYACQGMYKLAHEAQTQYNKVNDSLNHLVDQAQASLARMEEEKRDKIILEKDYALQALELDKQKAKSRNQWLVIMLISLIFLAVIAFFLMRFRQVKIKKKSEEKLQKVLRQVDVQMLETKVEANNATSYKIGQELHDNLSSKLAVVQMSMDGIRDKVVLKSPEMTDRFDEVELLLEESCEDIRDIAHNLQNKELKHSNLVNEIEQFIDLINKAEGIRVHFNPAKLPSQLSKEKQMEMATVAKLLIENVLRHAKAEDITVTMRNRENVLSLSVADNGKGFNIERALMSGGKGLMNARQRAERVGGQFTLDSSPGKGTVATIVIPINSN